MQLDYTTHARLRMAERAITMVEVEATITGFDVRYPDRDGNPCYVREINGRWVRVVIVKDSQPPRIKTVITF